MIALIASNKKKSEHIIREYQLLKSDVRYISSPEQLHGLPTETIIMLSPCWYIGKDEMCLEKFEYLIRKHNDRKINKQKTSVTS